MHLQYLDPTTIEAIACASNVSHVRIAAALAVAYALPLPSAALASPLTHFDQQLVGVAGAALAVFNEVRAIDFTQAMSDCKAFWHARYAVVHGAAAQQIAMGAGFASTPLTLFGIAYSLSQALLDELALSAPVIQPLYARITADVLRTNMLTSFTNNLTE